MKYFEYIITAILIYFLLIKPMIDIVKEIKEKGFKETFEQFKKGLSRLKYLIITGKFK